MSAFDVAAILVAAAAVFGCVNHQFLRLPSTSGTLLVALELPSTEIQGRG